MPHKPVWRELHWLRPLDERAALEVLQAWAADRRSPQVVLEVHATTAGVVYLLGAPLFALLDLQHRLRTAVPTARLTEPANQRTAMQAVRRVQLSTRHRPLRMDDPAVIARAILGALTRVEDDEQLVLQVVLGGRRIPLAVPNNSPSSVVTPWWQALWIGNGGQADGEKRARLREKVSDHGYAATVRIGVRANTPGRRQALILGTATALRLAEAPGLKLSLRTDRLATINAAARPWRWPLRLNASEVLALSAWPVGDAPLPGQPPLHPRLLPPPPGTTGSQRIIAAATAPGVSATLALPVQSALRHLHLLAPTGGGKSVLMTHLITQDIAAGRAVIVLDPQRDLVMDVLARIPAKRRKDVILLDPADLEAPVGFNPLATQGRNPEVVADNVLAVFKDLYGDGLGFRSADLLAASLLTLTRRPDASLVMLPLLLSNAGFRRSVTAGISDQLALAPFWQGFEALSEAERQHIAAPLANKVRPLILRPMIRNVLGQQRPRFSMAQVFRERKILLVPLARGEIGADAAALLAGLLITAIWETTTERASLPPEQRNPVMVYIDEFSAFMRNSQDLADALARSRGMGVSHTLSHQFLSQASPAMRAAVLANTRSRVLFQLAADDAALLARDRTDIEKEDLMSLGQYEIYASLFANGHNTPYASGRTFAPPPEISDPAEIRQLSRAQFGRPVGELEQEFAALLQPNSDEPKPGRSRRPRS